MQSLPEEPIAFAASTSNVALADAATVHHRKAHTNCYLDGAGGAGAEADVDAAEGALAEEAAQPHVIKGHLLL